MWRYMREKSIIKVCKTRKFKVGVHQGSSLSPYIIDLIMDVLKPKTEQPAPWDVLSAEKFEQKLERWRSEMEESRLTGKIQGRVSG